jgi:hypothetical protein
MSARLTVLYDAYCGFCSRCAVVLGRLDRAGRLRVVSLQLARERVAGHRPRLSSSLGRTSWTQPGGGGTAGRPGSGSRASSRRSARSRWWAAFRSSDAASSPCTDWWRATGIG